jgi:DNA-directed RNA polymerase subunit N (RpoN/RPB10)
MGNDFEGVLDLRKEGKTIEEVVDKLGVSFNFVNDVIVANNHGCSSVGEYHFQKVLELKKDGRTYREISDQLGVHRNFVNKVIVADNKKYSSIAGYQTWLIEEKGMSLNEYHESLVREHGFVSRSDYGRFLKLRRESSKNFDESDFLELRAEELGCSGLDDYFGSLKGFIADYDVERFLREKGDGKTGHRSNQDLFEEDLELVDNSYFDSLVDSSGRNGDFERFWNVMDKVVSGLLDRDQELFSRRFFHGETNEEIAGSLGVSASCVSARVRKLSKRVSYDIQANGLDELIGVYSGDE